MGAKDIVLNGDTCNGDNPQICAILDTAQKLKARILWFLIRYFHPQISPQITKVITILSQITNIMKYIYMEKNGFTSHQI